MSDATAMAPFSGEQVAALVKFQRGQHFAPYVCQKCGQTLKPTVDGLECANCQLMQDRVPAAVMAYALQTVHEADDHRAPLPSRSTAKKSRNAAGVKA